VCNAYDILIQTLLPRLIFENFGEGAIREKATAVEPYS